MHARERAREHGAAEQRRLGRLADDYLCSGTFVNLHAIVKFDCHTDYNVAAAGVGVHLEP